MRKPGIHASSPPRTSAPIGHGTDSPSVRLALACVFVLF